MVQVLLAFLESAASQTMAKRPNLLPILACKLLFRAFAGESDWPIEFVQVSHPNWNIIYIHLLLVYHRRVDEYVILYYTFN